MPVFIISIFADFNKNLQTRTSKNLAVYPEYILAFFIKRNGILRRTGMSFLTLTVIYILIFV